MSPHIRGYIINERRAGLRGYFTSALGPESATPLSGLQLPKLGETSSFFSWSSPKHYLGWKVVISRPLFEGSLSPVASGTWVLILIVPSEVGLVFGSGPAEQVVPALGASSSFSWSSPKHCLGWKVAVAELSAGPG